MIYSHWTPGLRPEGSYEFRSVRPSVRACVCNAVFLELAGSLVFSDISHEVRGPINIEKWQSPIFRENSHFPKNGKKGPKRPKKRIFGLLCKIESLLFARNDLKCSSKYKIKWSVLWLANFLWKFHIWENSRSRDLGQKGQKWVFWTSTQNANIQHNCLRF